MVRRYANPIRRTDYSRNVGSEMMSRHFYIISHKQSTLNARGLRDLQSLRITLLELINLRGAIVESIIGFSSLLREARLKINLRCNTSHKVEGRKWFALQSTTVVQEPYDDETIAVQERANGRNCTYPMG